MVIGHLRDVTEIIQKAASFWSATALLGRWRCSCSRNRENGLNLNPILRLAGEERRSFQDMFGRSDLDIPCDDEISRERIANSPPAHRGAAISNSQSDRVHPMEGWDGTRRRQTQSKIRSAAGGASAAAVRD